MRVALTGTPGTGKTTAAERLAEAGVAVIHLNDVIRDEGLWTERDDERGSLVADIDAAASWIDDRDVGGGPVVVESHLAHLVDADRVVVLRCRPDALEDRLRDRETAPSPSPPASSRTARDNAESTESPRDLDRYARENAESEALDVILSEAVERHGTETVYEIDTTDLTPAEVAAEVRAVLADEREPSAGGVDFTDYLRP